MEKKSFTQRMDWLHTWFGLILGWLRWWSGSLLVPGAVHVFADLAILWL